MEEQTFYAIEKRITTEDGRLMEHETIVCSGSEIECQYRIRELRKIQEENAEKDDPQEQDMMGGEGFAIQIDPEYYVVPAEKYDEEHSLNQQRSMMNRFMAEFWK
ncbi:MAG: hypothetical protein ACI4VM_04805 [Anaerovoracaceae bacterium]